MPTIPADLSMVQLAAPRASTSRRRLPRGVGLMMAGLVAGAMWYAIISALAFIL
jgi:hypothetical protein